MLIVVEADDTSVQTNMSIQFDIKDINLYGWCFKTNKTLIINGEIHQE